MRRCDRGWHIDAVSRLIDIRSLIVFAGSCAVRNDGDGVAFTTYNDAAPPQSDVDPQRVFGPLPVGDARRLSVNDPRRAIYIAVYERQ